MILLRALVAADNVVVEHGFQVPALLLRHLREMTAAVQSLLFAGDCEKNNRRRKLHLAQHSRAFQADGRSAAIVVGSRCVAAPIERVAVARIVVPGHQHHALRIRRIGALQDRINIGDFGCLRNPLRGFFGEAVGLHLEASAAIFRIPLELRLDPLPRRANAVSRSDRRRILRRQRQPRSEADQFLDVRLNSLRGNLLQRRRDLRIGRRRFTLSRLRLRMLLPPGKFLRPTARAIFAEMEHGLMVPVQTNPTAEARFRFPRKSCRPGLPPLTEQAGRI